MLLYKNPVSAIQWNGNNLEEIKRFITPHAVTDFGGGSLLIIDKVAKSTLPLPEYSWLTKPVNLPTHFELGLNNNNAYRLEVLAPSFVVTNFSLEMEDTDTTLCETCHKPTNTHLPVFGDSSSVLPKFELVCPPDFDNEIDGELVGGNEGVLVTRQDPDDDLSRLCDDDWKEDSPLITQSKGYNAQVVEINPSSVVYAIRQEELREPTPGLDRLGREQNSELEER